jgi:hypothetical protein
VAVELPEYNERVMAFINQRFPGTLRCPLCVHNKWNIAPLAEFPLRTDLGERYRGQAIPFVPLVCTTCGNVLQISAVSIGLIGESGD